MPTFLDNYTPADLGLPASFFEFRQIQRDLADFAIYGPAGSASTDPNPALAARRWHGVGASPGSGKSLAANAVGLSSGRKFVILTATKALERQMIEKDKFDLVTVHGRSNYDCETPDADGKAQSCEQGGESGCKCAGIPSECPYATQVHRAAETNTGIVTNYQYWMHARSYNKGALEKHTDPIGLLICDEFHLAVPGQLGQFLNTWIGDQDLRHHGGPAYIEVLKSTGGKEWGRLTPIWVEFLNSVFLSVSVRMAKIVEAYGGMAMAAARESAEYRKLSKLVRSLERVCDLGGDGNWLWQITRSGVSFSVIWPSRYAERFLWSGVDRVIPMSATLRPKALQLGGLKPNDYWFKEFPRVFPAANGPVWWVPTGKIGMKAGEEGKIVSLTRGDAIMEEWMMPHADRDLPALGGIVHTPSYQLAEWIYARSRFARYMCLADRKDPGAAAEKFRRMEADGLPCALIGPSYMTGHDFPTPLDRGRWGSWQWIPKLPFADKSDPVVETRAEADEQIYNYDAAQTLVQACGRRQRSPDCRTVTLITDDAIKNFRYYSASHMPKWFSVKDAPGGEMPRRTI